MKDTKIIKVVCNSIPRRKAGEVVSVKCNSRGVPLERQWRRYFKENPISKCFQSYVESEHAPVIPPGKPPRAKIRNNKERMAKAKEVEAKRTSKPKVTRDKIRTSKPAPTNTTPAKSRG